MPNSNIAMIKKLQKALNNKGDKILYQTSQFYSEQKQEPITFHHIKRSVKDEETGKNKHIELFKTTSMIQIVLFLRDLWYKANNIELPTDNEAWNIIRQGLEEFNDGEE